MRQRTDPDKLDQLKRYHDELIQLFKKGKLEGKITNLLEKKSEEIGVSLRTYKRRLKELTLN